MSSQVSVEANVDIDEVRAMERKQAGVVKTLKKEGANPADIKAAVEALKKLKLQLAEAEAKVKVCKELQRSQYLAQRPNH